MRGGRSSGEASPFDFDLSFIKHCATYRTAIRHNGGVASVRRIAVGRQGHLICVETAPSQHKTWFALTGRHPANTRATGERPLTAGVHAEEDDAHDPALRHPTDADDSATDTREDSGREAMLVVVPLAIDQQRAGLAGRERPG